MSDDKKAAADALTQRTVEDIDEDERRAAAAQGQHVCPKCGDWLPLELNEYQCVRKGHHVAVSRTSVYPAPTKADVDRDWQYARTSAFVLVVFVLVITGALLLYGALRKGLLSPPYSAPATTTGAS